MKKVFFYYLSLHLQSAVAVIGLKSQNKRVDILNKQKYIKNVPVNYDLKIFLNIQNLTSIQYASRFTLYRDKNIPKTG